MRRRFTRRRAHRRSVSWIPGWSGMDPAAPTQSRLITFANGIDPNTRTAFISLIEPGDILQAGGEDCVLQRMTYELGFYGGRKLTDTGAPLAVRMCIVIKEVHDTVTAPIIVADNIVSSADLAKDDILHTRDFIVPSNTGYESGPGALISDLENSNWVRGEVKAKRKLQNDHRVFVSFHTCSDAANVPQDFRFLGHLRTLLMHPR